LAVPGQHRLDQAQIDFGLAAAGDAVQQKGPVAAQGVQHRIHGMALGLIERRTASQRRGGRLLQETGFHPAPLPQPAQGGGMVA
jgi:hypothetical protein